MTTTEKFRLLKKELTLAGTLARDYFYSSTNPSTDKEDGSVVTIVDTKIETILRNFVAKHFPEDAVLGEEEGLTEGSSEFVWAIDPIDGTENFVRKIPFFAITITRLGPTAEDSFALIYNPISQQMFSSLQTDGSYENEHRCNLASTKSTGRPFVTVTGTSSSADWIPSARMNIFKAINTKLGKSGHYECSLLELAYVAAGRLEGIFQLEMNAWDTAAGLYIAKAAGAQISVLENGEWHQHEGQIKDLYGKDFLTKPTTFCSHPAIHKEALQLIGDPKKWSEG